jgi:hypothetical protein
MFHVEYYFRFRDAFPDFDTYVDEIKRHILDDTQFTNDELKLSYWLMVANYWMSPVAYYDDDLFKLNHAYKVSIHLPKLLNQMETMKDIEELADFNLTNEVVRILDRVKETGVESTQLAKRNDTPKQGNNEDLLTDKYLSQSERVSGEGSTNEDEDVEETTKNDDTELKQLMTKLSIIDYSFVESYVEQFRRDFLQIKIGGEFYQ